jgi:hypothetical protein
MAGMPHTKLLMAELILTIVSIGSFSRFSLMDNRIRQKNRGQARPPDFRIHTMRLLKMLS